LKNRSLVLLSGEGTTIPAAEAKALFLAYDPYSDFESPSPRILIARSSADPFRVGGRIAFARRVGRLIEDRSELPSLLGSRRVRFRSFDLLRKQEPADPENVLRGVNATVDLNSPEYEVTLVRAENEFLAVTAPGSMKQAWSTRRPRKRPFFHPSAIFPKLSRALVNLSRCKEGEIFLDPFAGTGSIPMEAFIIGASVVAMDQAQQMVRGAIANMKQFGQEWLGVLRVDSTTQPLTRVDAIATDIPYGRASSTRGRRPAEILELLLPSLADSARPSSFAVLMHPQDVRVEGTSALSVVEEHHLHVHKLLTRTITVLRRR
jgi:tRNA (guanine10-N2)-dimethyltransferase